jgi:hypothetical protein
MAALFDELLFRPDLFRKKDTENFPVTAQLEWANSQPRNAQTGIRTTSVGRLDPVNTFTMSVGLLNAADMDYVNTFLRGGYGSAYGCRMYLPHDHALTLNPIATADGVKTSFPIVRLYARPGDNSHVYTRRIFKPVVQVAVEKNGFQLTQPGDGVTARVPGAGTPNYFDSAFRVFFNDGAHEQLSGWTVDAKTGIVYFSVAPTNGTVILVTCVFDTPMAFDGNQFQMMYDYPSEVQYQVREILGPELGLT